jgi:flagellar hook-basal body complex protein FliE
MVNPSAHISGSLNSLKGVWGPGSTLPGSSLDSVRMPKAAGSDDKKAEFADAVKALGNYVSKVDDLQQSSEVSIQDLLSGKGEDIASVVSAVAKADMSFKLLVGVRNKLIEAYKQTMNMPL